MGKGDWHGAPLRLSVFYEDLCGSWGYLKDSEERAVSAELLMPGRECIKQMDFL